MGRLLALARRFLDLEADHLERAMRDVAPLARGRLLDVGCGDKPYEVLFLPHVEAYVGVEHDATWAGTVSARHGKADVVYAGDRLPFDDASFQTVLSNQVLEHVPDPAHLCREMARVLAPGGRLLVTVPFSYRLHALPHDYHRFTPAALEGYCRAVGLVVERIDPRGGIWAVIGQKIASHLVLRAGGLQRAVQAAGALTYEPAAARGPRWWALPLVAPTVVVAVAVARALDALDPDPIDTLGWMVVARKPAPES